jgi:hypothetical protein
MLNVSLRAAGVPADNDYTFCKSSVTPETCYFFVNQLVNFTIARSRCRTMGGQLAAYATDDEQLDVGGRALGTLWMIVHTCPAKIGC